MTNMSERWYRPPVVWLGAAILLASIAVACAVVATSG